MRFIAPSLGISRTCGKWIEETQIDGLGEGYYLWGMTLTEVEPSVMALPVDERKELAKRIWASIEPTSDEIDSLIRLCDEREAEADQAPDGWMPVGEFMDQMANRKK